MTKKVLTALLLATVATCLMTISYGIGERRGMNFGYTQGLRVADAWTTTSNKWKYSSDSWEERAKRCESK